MPRKACLEFRKVTPAERFRQQLLGAVAGAQESFSGYCRLAAQAMLQTAMEIEATDFIGRSSYQRRQDDQGIYRNGYKRRRHALSLEGVATGEGSIALHVPQTRDGLEPFQTRILEAYRRRSETLDALIPQLYVKGLSVRDVSDALTAVFQDAGVSPATASRIGIATRSSRCSSPTGFSGTAARFCCTSAWATGKATRPVWAFCGT
jgi:transposase-like protein